MIKSCLPVLIYKGGKENNRFEKEQTLPISSPPGNWGKLSWQAYPEPRSEWYAVPCFLALLDGEGSTLPLPVPKRMILGIY